MSVPVRYAEFRDPSDVRLTSDESGGSFLDESALSFTRIFSSAQRSTELLLAEIGRFEAQSFEFAYSVECGLNGKGGVGGDSVGGLERPVEKFLGWDEFVQEPHRERPRGIDRLRRVEEFRGMNRRNLTGQGDGGLSGRIQPEGDFFECEGGRGDCVSDLTREHQVEATGTRVSVDRSDQRNAQWLLDEDGVPDGSQPLEIDRVDPLAAREGLGHGNRAPHIHARAEDPIARPGENRASNRVVLIDALPMGSQVAKRLGVQGVGLIRAIEGHEGDMGVCVGGLESSGHAKDLSVIGGRRAKYAKLAVR